MELLDVSVIDKFNAVGGMFVVIATYFFGEHWMLFAAFLVLNIVDYITGIMKSKVLKIESSSAGLKGIIKKFGYWLMIILGFGFSPILNKLGEAMGIDLTLLSPVIGWYILAVLSLNEFRSIIENFVEAGYNVPPVLVKGLSVTEKLLQAQEKLLIDVDGDLNIDKRAQEKYTVDIKTPPEKLENKDVVTLKIHTIGDDD